MTPELKIDKDEVLRYLHHQNKPLEKNLDELVNILIKETINTARPRFIYNIFTSHNIAQIGMAKWLKYRQIK